MLPVFACPNTLQRCPLAMSLRHGVSKNLPLAAYPDPRRVHPACAHLSPDWPPLSFKSLSPRSERGTNCPRLATLSEPLCFQSLPTIKFCNSFVLITIRIAGGWVGGTNHRGVKVLLELPPQRIEGEGLTSRNSLEWVLPNLQLRTYDLSLFREDHHRAAPQPQRPRGVPFVHANLDEPARAQIRERLRAIPLRKRFHKPAHGLRPNLQFDRAVLCSALRQIFLPEIRNQIPERVRAQNHSFDYAVRLLGAGKRESLVIFYFIPHAARLPAFRKPRRHRRENVAPMKRFAHRLQVIMCRVGVSHHQAFRLALVNHREHAIVRRHKILIRRANQQRPPLGAYAGVHHYHVDRLRREIRIRRPNRQRTIEQIKRRDVVRDVHNRHIRIDLQDYALQRADQVIVRAVVRRQCDDRVGQGALSSANLRSSRTRKDRNAAPFDANECRRRRQESTRTEFAQYAYVAAALVTGWEDRPHKAWQPSAALTSRFALLRRATMPLRIGVMRAAEPLAAALAKLLSTSVAGFLHSRHSLTGMFLRLYSGGSGHGVLLGNGVVARKGVSGQVPRHPLCLLRCTQYTPGRQPLQPYCVPFRPRTEYLCAR